MIVQTLCHELQGERVLLAGGLFDFGPLVLEPDFDLCLVEAQLGAQLLTSSFSQVTVLVEFVLLVAKEEKQSIRNRAIAEVTAILTFSLAS